MNQNSFNEKKESPQSLGDYFFERSQKSKLDRLSEIKRTLNINQYKLVFIGEIGAGKTTAIAHLFGLTHEFTEERTPPLKPITRTKELLATASGGTTICEVVIQAAEKTSLCIEPYSTEELTQLIEIFAEDIFNKAHSKPSEQGKYIALGRNESFEQGKNIISTEVKRALRNVLDLKINNNVYEEMELVRQHIDLNSFKEMLLKRARISERTIVQLDYDGLTFEQKWVKETFEQLNVARLPDLSIPKKITLNLSNQVLKRDSFKTFIQIIDTKGLDTNKHRQDIESHIQLPETICIFCTRYPNAPDSSILEMMRQHLHFTSKKFHHKFITFVMPQNQEPEKVIAANGKRTDNWEEGIRIRENTIKDTFNNHKIPFSENSILFYDALRYYSKGKLDKDAEYDVEIEKKQTIGAIEKVIQQRKQSLLDEQQAIQRELDAAKAAQRFSSEEIQLLQVLKKQINTYSIINFSDRNDFSSEFEQNYRSQYHHNTQHAINRQFGIYAPSHISLYYDAKQLAIDLVRTRTEDYKNRLQKEIEQSVEQFSKDFKPIVMELLKQLDDTFDEFLTQVGTEIQDIISSTYFYPRESSAPFWSALIGRYGMGKGYTNAVCKKIVDQLTGTSATPHKNISNFIDEIVRYYWKNYVIDQALSFFTSEDLE